MAATFRDGRDLCYFSAREANRPRSEGPGPPRGPERAAQGPPRRRPRGRGAVGLEDEFISSVSDRVKTYGRAFGDPEKGDPNAPLSVLQAVKLKEIAAKAKRGKAKTGGAEEETED